MRDARASQRLRPARRDHEIKAADGIIRALALGKNAYGAAQIARTAMRDTFAGYRDLEGLFEAATQSSALARLTKAVPAVDFDPLDLGPLRVLMTRIAEASIVGKLSRAVRVPFTRGAAVQIVGSTAGFVAEGQAMPVHRSEFSAVIHRPLLVGAMLIVTRDSLMLPGSEQVLRDELVRAAGEAIDRTFASADAATDAAPAGIAADASTVASTGTTASAIATDLASMVDRLPSLAAPVWLLSPKANSYLRLLRVTSDDGTLGGFPVLSSAGVSGVTLLASDRVALSLSDEVALSVSDHASIEMDDAPSSDSVTPTESTLVSLFATNSRAISATALADWTLVGPSDSGGSLAVVSLSGASWD